MTAHEEAIKYGVYAAERDLPGAGFRTTTAQHEGDSHGQQKVVGEANCTTPAKDMGDGHRHRFDDGRSTNRPKKWKSDR